jgi:hypothetical protein
MDGAESAHCSREYNWSSFDYYIGLMIGQQFELYEQSKRLEGERKRVRDSVGREFF